MTRGLRSATPGLIIGGSAGLASPTRGPVFPDGGAMNISVCAIAMSANPNALPSVSGSAREAESAARRTRARPSLLLAACSSCFPYLRASALPPRTDRSRSRRGCWRPAQAARHHLGQRRSDPSASSRSARIAPPPARSPRAPPSAPSSRPRRARRAEARSRRMTASQAIARCARSRRSRRPPGQEHRHAHGAGPAAHLHPQPGLTDDRLVVDELVLHAARQARLPSRLLGPRRVRQPKENVHGSLVVRYSAPSPMLGWASPR